MALASNAPPRPPGGKGDDLGEATDEGPAADESMAVLCREIGISREDQLQD